MAKTFRAAFRTMVPALAAGASLLVATSALAQTYGRDGIADLLARDGQEYAPGDPAQRDPREDEAAFAQARRLMAAIDDILRDTAEQRSQATKLPGKNEFLIPPIWTETKEDREKKVRVLLDAALGIVTDVPIVDVQQKIEQFRKNIRAIEDEIVAFKEKQIAAPDGGVLPGMWTDTVASLTTNIKDAEARIAKNRDRIAEAKLEIQTALIQSGVELETDQLDLLLDSVLSSDLVRLVAVFSAAKLIDGQLAKLVGAAGDNMNAARRYFAMHAALFAMLVHAQDTALAKIERNYMPKLDAILKDVAATRAKTNDLLRAENRPDQRRALDANRESQKLADDAARAYRRYLQQQRDQIARARSQAAHDLRIADNTYETVEASFQLRNMMRDSVSSFEALQRLEAPTFDQIFKNEELRREFESLTRKLDTPSS